jgi:hypothetical protein
LKKRSGIFFADNENSNLLTLYCLMRALPIEKSAENPNKY